MTVKVTDFEENEYGYKYGYCTCGREVSFEKHKKCPLCEAKLEWPEEKK